MSTLLVERDADLGLLCAALADAPWIAFDTEFLRSDSYFPRLCLMQVATPERVAVVDAITIDDLDPLFELLLDGRREVVVHSGEQDFEILYHLTGRIPRLVFDTQIAATMLGLGDQVSYAAAVEALLGVRLDKAHTRTNWARRPLAPGQLSYAADDVRHLCVLYQVEREALAAAGRVDWIDDDTATLTNLERYRTRPMETWQRVKGKGRCEGPSLARLQAVAAWREREAMRADKPRRWILDDPDLLAIAEADPRGTEPLHRLGVRGAKAARLAAALDVARAVPASEWPRHDFRASVGPEGEAAADRLLDEVRLVAEALGVAPNALATRTQVKDLVAGVADTPLRRGWRADLLADAINRVLPFAAMPARP